MISLLLFSFFLFVGVFWWIRSTYMKCILKYFSIFLFFSYIDCKHIHFIHGCFVLSYNSFVLHSFGFTFPFSFYLAKQNTDFMRKSKKIRLDWLTAQRLSDFDKYRLRARFYSLMYFIHFYFRSQFIVNTLIYKS